MIYRCFSLAFACSVLLLAVAACDDPSTVGANVGPNPLRGGRPVSVDAYPAHFDTVRAPALTGNAASSVWRMLVGTVQDPLAGTITANGYVDFRGPVSLADVFYDLPPDRLRASLSMVVSYQHGDTTAAVDVALYDLTEEMDVADATADQTFPREDTPIRTATFSPTDSLVTIDLPTAWVAEHIETLRDTTDGGQAFRDAFHGLQVTTEGGNAVIGTQQSSIRINLETETDVPSTTTFFASKVFSNVERPHIKPPPSGRRVMVGTGTAVEFAFDFTTDPLDSLENAPVNTLDLFLPVDTSAWNEDRPPNFVRPRGGVGYLLRADRTADAPPCNVLNTATPSDTTCAIPLVSNRFPAAIQADPSAGLTIFQESLLSGPVFSRFQMEIAAGRTGTNTLGIGLPTTLPVVVYAPDTSATDSSNWPRATLTVTPL